MKNYCIKKNKKGFTLVELIIVIAILAILVGLLTVNVIRYIEKARVAKDKAMVDSAYTAVTTALADEKGYDNFISLMDELKTTSSNPALNLWLGGGAPTFIPTDYEVLNFSMMFDSSTVPSSVVDGNKFYDEMQKTFGSSEVKFSSKQFANQSIYLAFKIDEDTQSVKIITYVEGLTSDGDYYYPQ